MRRCRFPFLMLIVIVLSSCGCSQSQISIKGSMSGNSNVPVLLKVQSLSTTSVRLVFDKEVEVYGDSFGSFSAHSDGYGILVEIPQGIAPGTCVDLSGRVIDNQGNTSGFSTPVWGYNSRLPDMLINELATKDEPKTEILVTSAGNTAGAVLYNGIPSDHDGMAILPSLEVSEGDFIVVWWTSEKSKLYSNDVMADKSLIGKGYSNNGIQTLALSPAEGAEVLDCVIYSNKSSKFSGFGSSATETRVLKAVAEGWWNSVEDPVLSGDSTKLRTMCRKVDCSDTNSSVDWFTAKDSGATFGSSNTSEPFIR